MTQETDVAKAMAVIRVALEEDPAYAFSWHSNIAMSCYDAMRDYTDETAWEHDDAILAANDGAARFMKLCFGVETSQDMLTKEDE